MGLGTEAEPGQRSGNSGNSHGADGGSESPSERLGTSEVGEDSPFRKITRARSSETTGVVQATFGPDGWPDTGESKMGSCVESLEPWATLVTTAGEFVDSPVVRGEARAATSSTRCDSAVPGTT